MSIKSIASRFLQSDLLPPLGQGSSCRLIKRISDNVSNPKVRAELLRKVERGVSLSNPEAALIYKDVVVEVGPEPLKKIKIGPHAQYRMDQRGITVAHLKVSLNNFLRSWDQENRDNPFADETWDDLVDGRAFEWDDSRLGLKLSLDLLGDGGEVFIVTNFWTQKQDPRPPTLESCNVKLSAWRVASRFALKETVMPGYQTHVETTEPSTDVENNALQNPGLASPGSTGRDIGKFEFNTPGPGSNVGPRTLGVPGGDVPVNDNTTSFSRRTMTSSEDLWEASEGSEATRVAYRRRWQPGKRQHRSRGSERQKRRTYYRRNKAKIQRKNQIRRKKLQHNGAYKASEARRRKSNRKRIGHLIQPTSVEIVSAMHLHAAENRGFKPPQRPGGADRKKQREQTPRDKRQDQREYQADKSQRQHDALVWYRQRCRPSRRCKQRKEEYRDNPEKYKRRSPDYSKDASVLTVPDAAFVIGPEISLGRVHSLSGLSGMITVEIDGRTGTSLLSIPVEVFLRTSTFFSDEELESFLDLVEVEIGLEAYEDLDEELTRQCLILQGQDPDSEEFKMKCFEMMGESELSEMTPEQLDDLTGLVDLEPSELDERDHRSEEDAEENDETIPEDYDPHLFYGEVEYEKT